MVYVVNVKLANGENVLYLDPLLEKIELDLTLTDWTGNYIIRAKYTDGTDTFIQNGTSLLIDLTKQLETVEVEIQDINFNTVGFGHLNIEYVSYIWATSYFGDSSLLFDHINEDLKSISTVQDDGILINQDITITDNNYYVIKRNDVFYLLTDLTKTFKANDLIVAVF